MGISNRLQYELMSISKTYMKFSNMHRMTSREVIELYELVECLVEIYTTSLVTDLAPSAFFITS